MATDTTHDDYNPYTAVRRHPSQWFTWVPDAQPLVNNVTMLTVSHDAMNLCTIPASESMVSLKSNRYVVPEVYKSSSEVDIRSAGNPYSHHPNFATNSQYFGHDVALARPSGTQENVLTVMDIMKLKDQFGKEVDATPVPEIRVPNDVTLNKKALTSESLADLQNLSVHFPTYPSAPVPTFHEKPHSQTETLNKKLLSPESMYELAQVAEKFELSPETLAEFHEIRNTLSPGPSKDVATAMGMSPSPYEVAHFEKTENWAYGGI